MVTQAWALDIGLDLPDPGYISLPIEMYQIATGEGIAKVEEAEEVAQSHSEEGHCCR